MAAEELGQRMHDDVGAVLDRPHQIGRGERIVDDEGNAGLLGHRRDGGEVGDDAAGIGDRLDEDRLGFGRERRAEALRIVGIGKVHVPVEFPEGLGELVDRATIELARGDELIAGLEQEVKDERLRRVPRGHGKRRCAALQGGNALLKYGLGRVHNARIDVAEGLEVEQRRGVIDVLEHIGRRLVDRRGAGTGCGVGMGAGMDRQGVEAGLAFG
jgi:hypothetical protein